MNLWAHFLKIANLKAFLKKKNPAIFIIYDFFTPFVKLCGWRFLYFFSLCDGRNKAVFLKLEHSSLHGVKQKKHKKKHENLVFKPLLQEIWLKNLTIRKLFWSSKFSKRKKHATKSYRNWISKLNYVQPTIILSKIFDIHLQDSHRKFLDQMKYTIQHEQNCVASLFKKSKAVFKKLQWKISSSVWGEQVSKKLGSSFPFSMFRYFPVF